MTDIPALSIVIGSSIIDSVNPCSIGIIILLISTILGQKKKATNTHLITFVSTYILAVFSTYLAAGIGLLFTLSFASVLIVQIIALIIGSLLLLAAILELREYFWYGKGSTLRIPKQLSYSIHKIAIKHPHILGSIGLGVFVAVVELMTTSTPYLATITLLRGNISLTTIGYLIIYNIIFVLPLLLTLILVVRGAKISKISQWKEESKSTIRLFTGILLTLLGWIVLLTTNGTLRIG